MREVRLDSIAEVRLGRQRSPKNHEGPTMRPYLRAANVDWSGIRLDDVKMMNFTDSEMATYRLEPGDIVLGEASGSASEVGKPALWNGEIRDCAFQNTLLRVRTRGPEPKYLLHFFRFQAESGAFAARSRGVGIHHLGREALASYRIPIPSVDEQRRIAAILDHADALRTQRRAAVGQLDVLSSSIFDEMFVNTDGKHDWPTVPFTNICDEFRYGTSNKSGVSGFPALRIPNVIGGVIDYSEIKTVDVTAAELQRLKLLDGDLLFVRTNGNPDNVGRCAVFKRDDALEQRFDTELIYASYLIRARLDLARTNPCYVREFMLGAVGRRSLRANAKTSAGQFNINIDGIGLVMIPLPPLSLQILFAERIAAIEPLHGTQRIALTELDTLFASLQHRAFRGEL